MIGVLKDQINPDEAVTGGIPTAPEEILAFLDPPESSDHLGKLGPYRVVQVLGQGGMGVVLKAFDPALHRSVAIKVLAPQLATTSSARQRFAREAAPRQPFATSTSWRFIQLTSGRDCRTW